MLFNSPVFIVFFVAVFSLYWMVRRRVLQNVILLAASYVFYGAWSWLFLGLLLASTVVDFACGIAIDAASSRRMKRWVLLGSVATNLTFLGTFKYAGFFVRELGELLERIGFQVNVHTLEIVLPIGISFYTFQSLGYVVDVYRGKHRATRNLMDYALYVAFFPQLVAGPIERASHMIPQFQRPRTWSRAAFESGLLLMTWGLFKKVVIADNLAPYVDAVYADPGRFSGGALVTATVFFAFQIYCDFSGYTDTALGVARMLGFSLMKNFDYPYFSKTPVEFWRRWHISLSQWFQDYLYFPLAMHYMRKGGWGSRYKAHLIAMGLIGFWHGANWTFIVFGLYWGAAIALHLYAAEHAAKRGTSAARAPPQAAAPTLSAGALSAAPLTVFRAVSGTPFRAVSGTLFGAIPGTLLAAVPGALISAVPVPLACALRTGLMFAVICVGWVLFRAASLGDAFTVLSHMFSSTGAPMLRLVEGPSPAALWVMVVALWLGEWAAKNRPAWVRQLYDAPLRRMLMRYAMLVAILFSYVAMQDRGAQPFIYFQF